MAFDLKHQTQAKKSTKKRIVEVEGDIIISTDAVIKNAKIFDSIISDELSLYIVHGILHLLVYDDHGKKNTKAMRQKEGEIMKCLIRKNLIITSVL